MASDEKTVANNGNSDKHNKRKKYCLGSCLGCLGISALLIIAGGLIGWHLSSQVALAVEQGNQFWKDEKKDLAVAKYREADYGDNALLESLVRATVYQRCIEYEWSQGNRSAGVILIDRALEHEIPLKFSDNDIQAAVTQCKADAENRAAEKKKQAEIKAVDKKNKELNNLHDNILASIDDAVDKRIASAVMSHYASGDDIAGDSIIRDNPKLWAFESKLKGFRDYCRERRKK